MAKKKLVVDERCAQAAFEAFARRAGYDVDNDMKDILVSLAASVLAWEEEHGGGWVGEWVAPARKAFEDKYQPVEDE